MSTSEPIDSSPDGPIVRGASPALLAELLEEFEGLVRPLGVPVDEMNAGISVDNVSAVFAASGLSIPDELFTWFGWHDGSGTGWPALPLFVASAARDALFQRRNLDGVEVESEWGVPKGWLPLADGNYGCAIDMTGDPASPPRLRMARPDFDAPGAEGLMRAASLCTIVYWWIYGINSGGHRWDPEIGKWSTDVGLLHESQQQALFY